MVVKYQRTSTQYQHGNRFQTDTNSYDLLLFDKGISGTLPFKERTQAKKLIPLVESGQVNELVVEEIRDIGRNTVDSINTVDWLVQNGVCIVIRSMGVKSMVDGKPNPIWGLITSVMSSLYEMELENLKIRTRAGREAYLMRGGKLGRELGSNESIKQFLAKPKTKQVISLLNKGKSTRDIKARLGVSSYLVTKVRKYHQVS